MSHITVYNFLLADFREDRMLPARGKATREKIESIFGVVIEDSAEVIDGSLLNENDRYHKDQQTPTA